MSKLRPILLLCAASFLAASFLGCSSSPTAETPLVDDEAAVGVFGAGSPGISYPNPGLANPNGDTLIDAYEARVIEVAHRVFDLAQAYAVENGSFPLYEDILAADPELASMHNPLDHHDASAPMFVDGMQWGPGQVSYEVTDGCEANTGCSVEGLGSYAQPLVVLTTPPVECSP